MIRAHRVTEALQLSERLFERERSLFAAELFLLPAQIQRDLLSESEHEYFHNTLKQYIERAARQETRGMQLPLTIIWETTSKQKATSE
jgi:hypothetical protein